MAAEERLDGRALVAFIAALGQDVTRHPFTATVDHLGHDGERVEYRLEMWVDGRTAACRRSEGGFGMRYALDTRTLSVSDGRGLVQEESGRDYPSTFAPLAMAHPVHLPIWGGPGHAGSPAAVIQRGRRRIEVLVDAPEDGGASARIGRALIDTELMAALEFHWFGDHYLLRDPQRLVMPDWDSLLG